MSIDEELQILPKKGTGSAQVAIKDPDSSDSLIGPSEALFGAFEIFGVPSRFRFARGASFSFSNRADG